MKTPTAVPLPSYVSLLEISAKIKLFGLSEIGIFLWTLLILRKWKKGFS